MHVIVPLWDRFTYRGTVNYVNSGNRGFIDAMNSISIQLYSHISYQLNQLSILDKMSVQIRAAKANLNYIRLDGNIGCLGKR